MCLYANSKKPETAKEDLVCYKLVTDSYESPCQSFQYEIGKTYETELDEIKALSRKKNWSDIDLYNKRFLGFHTYIDEDFARSESNVLSWRRYTSKTEYAYVKTPKILQCIIPKGSLYYIGSNARYGDRDSCFCSNKLTVVKEIL